MWCRRIPFARFSRVILLLCMGVCIVTFRGGAICMVGTLCKGRVILVGRAPLAAAMMLRVIARVWRVRMGWEELNGVESSRPSAGAGDHFERTKQHNNTTQNKTYIHTQQGSVSSLSSLCVLIPSCSCGECFLSVGSAACAGAGARAAFTRFHTKKATR